METDSIYLENAKFLHQQTVEASEDLKPVDSDTGNQLPKNGVDPLVLAFYLLMEASNTTAQTAIIRSKQLGQNALAQQQLDNMDAQLQWYYVPKLQENDHKVTVSSTWHCRWAGTVLVWYQTKKYTVQKTYPNQGVVNEAEAKNQQVVADRQTIQQRLNVLQQEAQVGETGVNSFTDESMQAIQMGSNLLQILQSLTFQALMRHPPQ